MWKFCFALFNFFQLWAICLSRHYLAIMVLPSKWIIIIIHCSSYKNVTWIFYWEFFVEFSPSVLLIYWTMMLYVQLMENLCGFQVGMSIDPKLLVSNFPVISGSLGLLIGGKTILVALVGRLFGISITSAIRVGLLLAPGGEFAFVAFGEAVNQVSLLRN